MAWSSQDRTPTKANLGDRRGLGDDAPTTALPVGLPQGLVRRQEKLLPGLLPHGEAEPGLILPWFQAKGPPCLERGPAYGEIRHLADLPIDQLAVFQGGAHHLIAPAGQGVQQMLEIPGRQPHPRPDLKRRCCHRFIGLPVLNGHHDPKPPPALDWSPAPEYTIGPNGNGVKRHPAAASSGVLSAFGLSATIGILADSNEIAAGLRQDGDRGYKWG